MIRHVRLTLNDGGAISSIAVFDNKPDSSVFMGSNTYELKIFDIEEHDSIIDLIRGRGVNIVEGSKYVTLK